LDEVVFPLSTSLPDMLHIIINIGENAIFMEDGKALGRMQKRGMFVGLFYNLSIM
jgi:hypothetical protein